MIDFSYKANTRVLKKMTGLVLLSIVSYVLLVDFILPSSKYFVDYSTDEKHIVNLYKEIAPSVVGLQSADRGKFGGGSGVYIADYLIVTNSHVAALATKEGVMAAITSRGTFRGKLLERYPHLDLALVYTPENRGVPAKLGDSYILEIGDEVVSIGSPFGQYNTLGVGYVTGLNRMVALPPYSGIISSSAGIMPGSSGGGLFNLKGDLVGIPYAGVKSHSTLGFVIPIDIVKKKFKFYLRR